MLWGTRPIDKVRTRRSNLHYSDTYARLAASRWAGFRVVEEFAELDDDIQARLIAEYETAMQIQAVLMMDAEDKQRRMTER